MFVNQMFGDFAKWLWIESRLIHCDSSGVIREKNSLDSSLHTIVSQRDPSRFQSPKSWLDSNHWLESRYHRVIL